MFKAFSVCLLATGPLAAGLMITMEGGHDAYTAALLVGLLLAARFQETRHEVIALNLSPGSGPGGGAGGGGGDNGGGPGHGYEDGGQGHGGGGGAEGGVVLVWPAAGAPAFC